MTPPTVADHWETRGDILACHLVIGRHGLTSPNSRQSLGNTG